MTVTGTGVRNSAESTTGWSAGALDGDSKIQGSNCIGAKTGSGTTRYNHLGTPTLDFSVGGAQEGEHVVVWFNFLTFATLDTLANGGVRAYVGNDAGTNFEEYNITGLGSGYFGGWVAAVYDPQPVGDNSGGTYANTAADAFGITYNATAGIMGNFNNGLVDQITIGFGMQMTGGTPDGTFDDFDSADAGSNIWGWMQKSESIYFVQGKLEIGDGTTTTAFTDTNAVVVFNDRPVQADFYELLVATDATCTLGALSGGVTSGGCSFDSAGTSQYTLTVTQGGTVEAVFNCYASTFANFRQADLNASSTVQDTTFRAGGTVTQNGATITNGSISDSTATVAFTMDDDSVVSGVNFTGNDRAVDATSAIVADEVTLDGLTFSGNTVDVRVNSANDITIIKANGSDASTCENIGAGSCTIVGSVPVNVNVVDANNNPIQNAQTTVRLSSDNSEIINGDTDVNGDAPSGSFTGTTPAGALIKVRKSSPGDTRYENFSTTGTIESGTGLSVTVVLTEDGAL